MASDQGKRLWKALNLPTMWRRSELCAGLETGLASRFQWILKLSLEQLSLAQLSRPTRSCSPTIGERRAGSLADVRIESSST
jgi:hypothetical protein